MHAQISLGAPAGDLALHRPCAHVCCGAPCGIPIPNALSKHPAPLGLATVRPLAIYERGLSGACRQCTRGPFRTAPIITLLIPGTPLKTTPLQKRARSMQNSIGGCRIQDLGTRGYRRWRPADFSHSARCAPFGYRQRPGYDPRCPSPSSTFGRTDPIPPPHPPRPSGQDPRSLPLLPCPPPPPHTPCPCTMLPLAVYPLDVPSAAGGMRPHCHPRPAERGRGGSRSYTEPPQPPLRVSAATHFVRHCPHGSARGSGLL